MIRKYICFSSLFVFKVASFYETFPTKREIKTVEGDSFSQMFLMRDKRKMDKGTCRQQLKANFFWDALASLEVTVSAIMVGQSQSSTVGQLLPATVSINCQQVATVGISNSPLKSAAVGINHQQHSGCCTQQQSEAGWDGGALGGEGGEREADNQRIRTCSSAFRWLAGVLVRCRALLVVSWWM